VSVVFVVLGPLVVVLAVCRPIFTFWRIQAKSVTVPVIISSFVHLVPCLPNVLCRSGFRKKVKSDVTAKMGVPRGSVTIVAEGYYSVGKLAQSALRRGASSWGVGRPEEGRCRVQGEGLRGVEEGAAHSEAQGRRRQLMVRV